MRENYFTRLITLGIVFLLLMTTGCAVKEAAWGDLETGLILKYQLPKDQNLTYKGNSDTVQSLEVMGQSMSTTIKVDTGYSIKGTGVDEENNLMAQVIIGHINVAMNSPQGNMNPDTTPLNGKSYSVTYASDGKEIKVTGVEALPKISLGQGQERDAKELFSDLLPVLPDTPVKKAESWTTPTDKNVQQGQIAITLKGETTSVFEGIETLQGMECAKIISNTVNKVEGSGTQMGQQLDIKGETTGTSTWYFAYKKGLFVKATSNNASDLKIKAGSMEIPQKTESKSEVELVP